MKTSKKELKQYAERNEAYYFTGNVYSYENVVYYLEQLAWRTETGEKTKNQKRIEEIKEELIRNTNKNYFNSLQDIIYNITSIKHDSYKVTQLLYSAGLYGNSGQLHEIRLYYKNNIVGLYYLYY